MFVPDFGDEVVKAFGERASLSSPVVFPDFGRGVFVFFMSLFTCPRVEKTQSASNGRANRNRFNISISQSFSGNEEPALGAKFIEGSRLIGRPDGEESQDVGDALQQHLIDRTGGGELLGEEAVIVKFSTTWCEAVRVPMGNIAVNTDNVVVKKTASIPFE